MPKGTATVGVGRQDTGTAGRIEVAQVAVYLVYAGLCGQAFLDRERSLPAVWAADPHRRVPAEVAFATKPALARRMVTRALDAGVGARWFAGDAVNGNDPHLRCDLHARELGYVLTIARSHQVGTVLGRRRAVDLAVRPQLAWHRQAAGAGGHRCYGWALIGLHRTDSDRPPRRAPRPAGAPPPAHRCDGVLPHLDSHPRPAVSAGQRRRPPLDHRGSLQPATA